MNNINKIVEQDRIRRFKDNEQLSLGELIDKLKDCIDINKDNKKVVFDFEYAFPTGLNIWRGSYSELSINYSFNGYDNDYHYNDKEPLEINEFIKLCQESIGKVYHGWKGGEYTMTEDTPLWVANSGNSGNTAVIDIFDNGYEVVIITKWMDY